MALHLRTRVQLLERIEALRGELKEAEAALRTMGSGEVDAGVANGPEGEEVGSIGDVDLPYRMLVEQVQEGAAILAEDTGIVYCNRRFGEMLRRPAEQVVGSRLVDYVMPEQRGELQTLLSVEQSHTNWGAFTLLAQDGTRVPMELSATTVGAGGSRVIGLVAKDLTGERHREEIEKAGRLAQSILEHVAEAVVVCDRELRIIRASAAAHRLCGGDPLGKRFDEAFPLRFSSACGTDARSFLLQSLAGQRFQGVDTEMIDATGRWVHLMVGAAALRNEAQQIMGCVVTLTDVTHHKQMEETHRQAKEQAEAASRGKDEFLALLSHELRTPLSPVLMSVSALEMRGDLPAEVRAELSMVRRNMELEARLIDDLLDLTRISRGKLELSLQVVDVCTLLRQAVEICAGEIHAKELELALDVEPGRYYLRADVARLQQVFWNLIKNAIKFTPQEGRITVRCYSGEGRRVMVEVKDTGIGIEPGVLPRLFVPFEQGGREMTRRFGGLGLGLAISRGLVELHGGRLQAYSEGLGRGATFTVELPAEDPPAVVSAEPQPERLTAVSAGSQGHLRILLVEDHVDTARTMANLLESFGHAVRIAGGVEAALELARQEAFDLMVGDLGLPDGSGLDLMRQLKERYGLEGIAISGYGMQDDIEKSRAAGYLQHIIKPVNVQQLESVIQSVMQRVLAGKPADELKKKGSGE